MRRLCLFVILLAAWPKAVQAGDQTYTITAAIAGWGIAPGFRVQAYTYNGAVPGPELRGIVGDTFRITLVNRLPVATSIHWHGVPVPNGMDGVPGISAPAVMPGETFTYIFTVMSPGTYWYHPHANSAAQIARGLYGLLIVEPNIRPEYDREVSLVIGEYGLALMGGGMGGGTLLINGKTGPAIPEIRVRRGEKILFRMVNTGNIVHPMHVHGISDMRIWHSTPDAQQFPRRVRPGETVTMRIGTWPIESGQDVWLDYEVDRGSVQVDKGRVEAVWRFNEGVNSYWDALLGPFNKGEVVTYTAGGRSPYDEAAGPTHKFRVGPQLYLALMWHQHQPVYKETSNSEGRGSYIHGYGCTPYATIILWRP